MPATVATTSPARDHLTSRRFRVDITALRSSGGMISPGSTLASDPPAVPGPLKAPMMRALRVCGLLLPFPVGDMATSGYRRRGGSPDRHRRRPYLSRLRLWSGKIRQGA